MLRARFATAAAAIPLLLAIILYGPAWLFAVVVGVLAILGVAEYAGIAFPTRPADRALNMGLGTALVLGMALPNRTHTLLGAVLAGIVAVGLTWTVLLRRDFEAGLHDFGLSLIGIFYTGLLLPHFIWLHGLAHGPLWVIFVLLVCMAGDTGGYAVGHALGRHKLAPRISPGKTIEGSIGIVLASLLAGALAQLVFLPQRSWTEVMTLSVAISILGQLGDLSESIMKRTFGVKDSGWLFPGHGGILDRTDSLLFPVTFLYYYLSCRQ
ncbi:MAG: phosphatidate cytidylyltransferase [Candidatus Binatia bacterium]